MINGFSLFLIIVLRKRPKTIENARNRSKTLEQADKTADFDVRCTTWHPNVKTDISDEKNERSEHAFFADASWRVLTGRKWATIGLL